MDELILKIVLAVIVGGIIGAEREMRTGIGMRTMMLICLGATLFTIMPIFSPLAKETRAVLPRPW